MSAARPGGPLPSLRHYWRSNVAVVLTAAVAASVLTGALMVGDSVRGSLRDLTLDRLGGIDHALLGAGFFREGLRDELAEDSEFGSRYGLVSAAILMQGSMVDPESGRRAARINVQGIDDAFAAFFRGTEEALDLSRRDGQLFASIAVNRSLASSLAVDEGDSVLLYLERPSEAPRASLMGEKDPADQLESVRLSVVSVLEDVGAGRFQLAPHQSQPLVAYLRLRDLQRELDRRNLANTLLVGERARTGSGPVADPEADPEASAADVERRIRSQAEVADFGLTLEATDDHLLVTTSQIILGAELAREVQAAASEVGAETIEVSTYLANRAAADSGAAAPYSTITALDVARAGEIGVLRLTDGRPAPGLGRGEVLVNSFLAEDLAVGAGDRLAIDYFQLGDREQLIEQTVETTVAGVVEMRDWGVDRTLTPDFPGVADADNMSDWDPTFPVDLSRIRDQDEAYWDEFRATPKLFVGLDYGAGLWSSRFGHLTSLRLLPPTGMTPAELRETLEEGLPDRVALHAAGLAVEPVKARGLRGAAGATDFGGLFVGFSLFLIVSAALLVGLFFRLGTEGRANEMGLLLALGYGVVRVRRRFLVEGALLGGGGVILGLAGAVLYAGAMMAALRTLWRSAVGSSHLYLHVEPLTLVSGGAASVLVVLFAIRGAVGRLAAVSPIRLLRGETSDPPPAARAKGRRARWTASVGGGIAAVLLGASAAAPASIAAYLFFGGGACLLIAGLAGFVLWLRKRPAAPLESWSLRAGSRMAAANASLNPGRSLLCAALVASASFVIVAVGAYGLRFGEETRALDSGAGGFDLVAEADVSILADLTTVDGRYDLGFGEEASTLIGQSQVVAFRTVPGDDISCLNLFQPERPRLLGAPPELIERGGFRFQALAENAGDEPWRLLEEDLGPGVIPAIGDFNSVMWILHSGLGQGIEIETERGDTLELRLVGLLRKSVFQSELVISEANLAKHFPSRTGASYFLLRTPPGEQDRTMQELERTLGGFGFDAVPTAQRLQAFQAVENTYLGTFQTLGGLGLLLGTLGLAVVLLRNLLERRGELATMQAIGFWRRALAWLVVAENGLVLTAGVAVGAASALVAVSPHLLGGHALVPWLSLALTLLLVMAAGTLASLAAVRRVTREELLPALRGS
ncbi:MAG: FtsX-like permease family protein [Acidobacteria bacterium]|nr:FtsX-like permease family protein [Acidobacteriota bacterium]